MIELRNISKSFAHTLVLEDLNLKVSKGETMVLLGLSGSGKTTTLKIINGLVKPDSGDVFFNGILLSEQNLQEVRLNTGYIIQQGGLFPHYTVAENIAVVPRILKWDKEYTKQRTQLLLQKLHLEPEAVLHRYPSTLSGGQQQRISIARALAGNPEVLLMDEPFGALDPLTRQSILEEFQNLDELRDKTKLLVTHDVKEAFELGDRIAIMDAGKILQMGTPHEILHTPANDFVKRFIAHEFLSLKLKADKRYTSINAQMQKNPDYLNNLYSQIQPGD